MDGKDGEEINIHTVTVAGVDRGLTVDAVRKMEIGHVVDFIYEYNRIHGEGEEDAEKDNKPKRRDATQADIDAFWG